MHFIEAKPLEEVVSMPYIDIIGEVAHRRDPWEIISYYWRMIRIKKQYNYLTEYRIHTGNTPRIYEYDSFRCVCLNFIIPRLMDFYQEDADEPLPTRGLYYKGYEILVDREDSFNSILNDFVALHNLKLLDFKLTRESKAMMTTNFTSPKAFVPNYKSIGFFPLEMKKELTVIIVEKSTIPIAALMQKKYRVGAFVVLETKGYSSKTNEELLKVLQKRYNLQTLFIADKDLGGLRSFQSWWNVLNGEVTYLKIEDAAYVVPDHYVLSPLENTKLKNIKKKKDEYLDFIVEIAEEILTKGERIHLDKHSRLSTATLNLLLRPGLHINASEYIQLDLS